MRRILDKEMGLGELLWFNPLDREDCNLGFGSCVRAPPPVSSTSSDTAASPGLISFSMELVITEVRIRPLKPVL